MPRLKVNNFSVIKCAQEAINGHSMKLCVMLGDDYKNDFG